MSKVTVAAAHRAPQTEVVNIQTTLARLERASVRLEAGEITAQEALAQASMAREKSRAGQVRLAIRLAAGKRPSVQLEQEFE